MQYWHTNSGIPIDKFLSPDGLHMNDWSYGAMAKLLAKALADAFVSPKSA